MPVRPHRLMQTQHQSFCSWCRLLSTAFSASSSWSGSCQFSEHGTRVHADAAGLGANQLHCALADLLLLDLRRSIAQLRARMTVNRMVMGRAYLLSEELVLDRLQLHLVPRDLHCREHIQQRQKANGLMELLLARAHGIALLIHVRLFHQGFNAGVISEKRCGEHGSRGSVLNHAQRPLDHLQARRDSR